MERNSALGKPLDNPVGPLPEGVPADDCAHVQQPDYFLCPATPKADEVPHGLKFQLPVSVPLELGPKGPGGQCLFTEIQKLAEEPVPTLQFKLRVLIPASAFNSNVAPGINHATPEVLASCPVWVNLTADVAGKIHVQPVFLVRVQHAQQVFRLFHHRL